MFEMPWNLQQAPDSPRCFGVIDPIRCCAAGGFSMRPSTWTCMLSTRAHVAFGTRLSRRTANASVVVSHAALREEVQTHGHSMVVIPRAGIAIQSGRQRLAVEDKVITAREMAASKKSKRATWHVQSFTVSRVGVYSKSARRVPWVRRARESYRLVFVYSLSYRIGAVRVCIV